MRKSQSSPKVSKSFVVLAVLVVGLLVGLKFFVGGGQSLGMWGQAKAPSVVKKPVKPTVQQTTQVIPLQVGWNDLALHVFPNWFASDVCAQSRVVQRLARWLPEENAYEQYFCENPTTANFRIVPNVGYMVMSYGPGPAELIATGPVVPYFTELQEGNNLIGLSPIPSMPGMASDLCGSYPGSNLKVTWVGEYRNGSLSPHLCPPYPQFNDFKLSLGKSYFVHAVAAESVTKEAEPIISAFSLPK